DPSGRDETRAVKPPDQIKSNAKKYMDQIGKIVKVEDAEVHLNGNWFDTVNFDGLLTLLSKFTVQQILTRDDFAKRMAGNVPISLHELLYPI
ncbi:tyrosine--tRNA ligase, partial [Acinetobacter baumannii]